MRTLTTDTVLIEFTGHYPSYLLELHKLARGYGHDYPPEDDPWWSSHEVEEETKTLMSKLQAAAPEGYFFGGHPADPFALGYWPKTE